MTAPQCLAGRRNFLRAAASFSVGAGGLTLLPESATASDDRLCVVGPRTGYSPQIGTLVSMMTWMRGAALGSVRGLSQENLDYLFDSHANRIGALLLHLAATETYYQMNTFEGMKWDSWPDAVKQKWDPAMGLGKPGRDTVVSRGALRGSCQFGRAAETLGHGQGCRFEGRSNRIAEPHRTGLPDRF